jgi:hypothetical protein
MWPKRNCISRVVRTPKLSSLVFLNPSCRLILYLAPHPSAKKASILVNLRPRLAYTKANVRPHVTFQLKVGTGKVMLEMENTMLDYMLVVGNRIGLSAMLPNTANALQFTFDMDLKKPRKAFKGKHGMVGFDTRGRMLYIGQSRGEDIFLAMAPKTFLKRTEQRCASGYSSGPSQMSRRHARQVILMVIHFLGKIEALSYVSYLDPYEQDLDCDNKEWEQLNSAL